MTIDEAKKIIENWSVYLEYTHGKLSLVFGPQIPESFLPFHSSIIEEAINIVAKQHHDMGDKEAVSMLQSGIGLLTWYVNDEVAISQVAELFKKKEWREAVVYALEKFKNHKTRAY